MSKSIVLALISLIFLQSACSDERTRDLNRVSRSVITAAKNSKETAKNGYEGLKNLEMPELEMPTTEDVSGASDAFVEKLSTATAEKVAEKMSAELNSNTKEAKEAYHSATRAIRSTKDSARSKIRWVARHTPRSEREANQLVYSYGEEWMKEFRTWLDAAAKSNALRVDRRAGKRADPRRARKN